MSILIAAVIPMEMGSMKAKHIFVRLMTPSPAHSRFSRIPIERIHSHYSYYVKYQLHSNCSQLSKWQHEKPYPLLSKTILVKF